MLISIEKNILKSLFIFLLFSMLFNSFGEEIEIDEETSIELKRFERACEHGDAEGCNTAASILFSFEIYNEAFFLFKKGCDKLNNAISCYNVGDFFFNGYGSVSKNESKAIKYWKKACEFSIKSNEKYCGGCYSLGNLYLHKNAPKKALYYFSLDCSKDCCEACFEIEDMYKNRLISKREFFNIKNKNKITFETCDFIKKLSDSRSHTEE
ncbi:MAG: hypothetical protein DSY59_00345 [Persephonella sp.]|nr:MAG: hypothetical protein DSY59_00345 [Persephonella sp.]